MSLLLFYKIIVKIFSGSGLSKYDLVKKIHRYITSKIHPEFIVVDGYKVFLDKNDCHGYSVASTTILPEKHLLEKEIQSGDTVIDVGANIGYYTLLFAKLVGKTGKVFAFEPVPENYKILKKNIEVNGLHNVIAVQMGISNITGTAKLYKGKTAGSHSLIQSRYTLDETISIDVTTLDEYFERYDEKIDFVKSDTEGHDFNVLQGMPRILESGVKLMIEFDPYLLQETTSRKFVEFLQKRNYVMQLMDYELVSPNFITLLLKNNFRTDNIDKQTLINLGFQKGKLVYDNQKFWVGGNLLCKVS